VGPKYVSGDEFSVSVLIKDGEASFEIITNEEVYQETFIPGSDWGEYSEDYYLKAGVYTEGDDKEPQIKFSSFSLNY